jgi:hypothetical protein
VTGKPEVIPGQKSRCGKSHQIGTEKRDSSDQPIAGWKATSQDHGGNPQQFASEDSLRTIAAPPRIPKDRVESLKIAWQRQLQHELVLRGNVAGHVAILTDVGGPLRGEAPISALKEYEVLQACGGNLDDAR